MKKKVIAFLMMAGLVLGYGCDDQYQEIEDREILELQSTEDDDDDDWKNPIESRKKTGL